MVSGQIIIIIFLIYRTTPRLVRTYNAKGRQDTLTVHGRMDKHEGAHHEEEAAHHNDTVEVGTGHLHYPA